ncbi:sulfite oxidase heme-binding subunit YedZ [Flavimaricola marinus]|uniref:Sulfoxide reductase heme-binding subunit YedZ n=1 Tax=Flavimaricola marinus TaxID=1819565 RepID=A0A238LB45_9RHOB|nr:ferric reductase-like transmembrane domain-containing protein [Flavimaricola marinus]SMY06773.1 Sulfoxide reductase heme-binding subunit YedZ [Flavimaricola marinus]
MSSRLSAFFDRTSPYLLWFVLSLPALGMINTLINAESDRVLHFLLHPTGETSARLLIVSMMATPLMLLFKGRYGSRWLVRNRRYLGVAAFAYAALHTMFYLMSEPFSRVLAEATDLEIWTGWVAFAIFIPLAATSFDYAVRRMGTAWKSLQRWVYAAAVLTLIHWASLHDWRSPEAAIVHFAPLAALTLYRLWWVYLRRRPSALA